LIKIFAGLCVDVEKLILKFIWKGKGTVRAKINSKKKNTLKIWMTHSIQFQHGIERTDTMINETDLSAQK